MMSDYSMVIVSQKLIVMEARQSFGKISQMKDVPAYI